MEQGQAGQGAARPPCSLAVMPVHPAAPKPGQAVLGAGDMPTRGPLGPAGDTHPAPVPSPVLPHPAAAPTHQKHPGTAASGHQGLAGIHPEANTTAWVRSG